MAFLDALPETHRHFFEHLELMVALGDYLFVHAGIDPRFPIDEQKLHDLRWIREPFLSHPVSHGPVVVHGHTISDQPEDCGNRIGIDTGAFMSGQFEVSARRHAVFHASPAVICFAQTIRPVSRSIATNASLMLDAGAL